MDSVLRSYPVDSGQAAARIVALAMVADGRVQSAETAALDALQAPRRLALTDAQWHAVVEELCDDLIGPARAGDETCITPDLLDHALDEVSNPKLRRSVLRLCSAVAHADRSVDEAESFVLLAAVERWGLRLDDPALLDPWGRA